MKGRALCKGWEQVRFPKPWPSISLNLRDARHNSNLGAHHGWVRCSQELLRGCFDVVVEPFCLRVPLGWGWTIRAGCRSAHLVTYMHMHGATIPTACHEKLSLNLHGCDLRKSNSLHDSLMIQLLSQVLGRTCTGLTTSYLKALTLCLIYGVTNFTRGFNYNNM